MRPRVLLFLSSCFLGGLGGVLGSVVGNAGGRIGLFTGGVIGGLIGAAVSSYLARWRGWIGPQQHGTTAIGAGIGFLAAALVATQTLRSPVGPVLSTVLIGVGALAGAGVRRDTR